MNDIENLSDDELNNHIEAYAEMIASGIDVKENNDILEQLLVVQEKRTRHAASPEAIIPVEPLTTLKKDKAPLGASRQKPEPETIVDTEPIKQRKKTRKTIRTSTRARAPQAKQPLATAPKNNTVIYLLIALASLIVIGLIILIVGLLIYGRSNKREETVQTPPVVTAEKKSQTVVSQHQNATESKFSIYQFEFLSYNKESWQKDGIAFGDGPVNTALPKQTLVGFNGKFANSLHSGSSSTGRLLSPKFTVQKPFMQFKMAGSINKNCSVKLIHNGQLMALSIVTTNGSQLSDYHWDLSKIQGKQCQIMIEDADDTGWIAVDEFKLTDKRTGIAGKTFLLNNDSNYEYMSKSFDVGAGLYLDRKYKFASVPEFLKGCDYLKFKNDLKMKDNVSTKFRVPSDATAFILWDKRLSTVPWLKGWEELSEDKISVRKDINFNIFSKSIRQGEELDFKDIGKNSKSTTFYVVVIQYD